MFKPSSLVVTGLILSTTAFVFAEENGSKAGVARISDFTQNETIGFATVDQASTILPTTCNSHLDAEPDYDGKVPMLQQWGAYPIPETCCALPKWVTYKDLDEVHPGAKPMTVWVLDPHFAECNCREKKMVPIQICVPPCSLAEIDIKKRGRHVTYTYGKYAVDIRVHSDHVEVDYQKGPKGLLGLLPLNRN